MTASDRPCPSLYKVVKFLQRRSYHNRTLQLNARARRSCAPTITLCLQGNTANEHTFKSSLRKRELLLLWYRRLQRLIPTLCIAKRDRETHRSDYASLEELVLQPQLASRFDVTSFRQTPARSQEIDDLTPSIITAASQDPAPSTLPT